MGEGLKYRGKEQRIKRGSQWWIDLAHIAGWEPTPLLHELTRGARSSSVITSQASSGSHVHVGGGLARRPGGQRTLDTAENESRVPYTASRLVYARHSPATQRACVVEGQAVHIHLESWQEVFEDSVEGVAGDCTRGNYNGGFSLAGSQQPTRCHHEHSKDLHLETGGCVFDQGPQSGKGRDLGGVAR